ncbi:MAG: HAD family hydrolase [Planctomycetes bacterium]|nr:HAD family hydrolase [Planctomycetota bacterium]
MSGRAVIFDWDGVLADSAQMYVGVYASVAARYGKTLPTATLEGFREWYNPRWEQNYVSIGITGPHLKEALVYGLSLIRYDAVPLFPGIPEVLRDLRRDHLLGIASTTPGEHIRRRLETAGLQDFFAAVEGKGTAGSDKAQTVGKVLDALGAGPAATLMVGDTTADVEAARHWGLPTIGVTYGWMAPHRIAAANPTALVHTAAELPAAVRRVLGTGNLPHS